MRREHDLLGELDIPEDAYYGIQTFRSVENFQITGLRLCDFPDFIKGLAYTKQAAAEANHELGYLSDEVYKAMIQACKEVAEGKFDKEFVRIIEKGSLSEFADIPPLLTERAGECGLNSFLILSGLLSCYKRSQELLSYEGPFGVGYGVARFNVESIRQTEDEDLEIVFNKKNKFILPDSQTKDPYINLARRSIIYYLKHNKFLKPKNTEGIQSGKAGVFVCLKKKGELRGCIGTILPTKSRISEEIIKNAVSAALNDPRFPPVDLSEMNEIICSVDILAEPEEIKSISDLDVKRFGVIVSSGSRTGLLLPNLEGIDSAGMQVAIALQKGGISPEEPYRMYRFEVIRHE